MSLAPSVAQTLDGRIVLVRQTQPPYPGTPVAMRGQLRISMKNPDEPTSSPGAGIALSFPAAFDAAPEEIILALSDDQLAALLATEREGTYEHVHQGALDDLRTRLPVAKIIPPRT